MARCSRNDCRRWRPTAAVRLFGLGRLLDGAWFCSTPCLEAHAAHRLRDVEARVARLVAPAHRLGSILVQQRRITPRQLTAALDAQQASGLKLGTQLQDLGFISRETLLGALSAQSGVKYLAAIDHQTVRTGPGGLSAAEVRALGLVPFGESGAELLVACAAPVPRMAVGALAALVDRPVQPFLVADDEFERLLSAYGASAEAPETTTVRDIPDGAARIAAAAASGAVSIREARVDPYTWVRIAANGRVSTLLVEPGSRSTEEQDKWQADITQL